MSCLTLGFFLAIAAPSAALYACIGSFNPSGSGQSRLLTVTLRDATLAHHQVLFLMTTGAWIAMLIGYRLAGGAPRIPPSKVIPASDFASRLNLRITLLSWLAGLIAMNVLVRAVNQDTVWQAIGVIGTNYRLDWNSSNRGLLDSNAFALLNELVPLVLLGFAVEGGFRWLRTVGSVEILLLFALGTGSRRALLIAAVVLGLFWVNVHPKRLVWLIFVLCPLAFVVIIYGRGLFRFASGSKAHVYAEVSSRLVRDRVAYTASEVGISQVESLRTLQWFDGPPRFGIDHALSLVRMLPEQSVLGFEFAPRFTRHATQMHLDEPNANDIPVGFIGSLWVDAFWAGLAVAGLFAFCLTRVDRWIDRYGGLSPAAWYARGCLGFLLAFPFLNTGSLDFTFSPAPVLVIGTCLLLILINRPLHLANTPQC